MGRGRRPSSALLARTRLLSLGGMIESLVLLRWHRGAHACRYVQPRCILPYTTPPAKKGQGFWGHLGVAAGLKCRWPYTVGVPPNTVRIPPNTVGIPPKTVGIPPKTVGIPPTVAAGDLDVAAFPLLAKLAPATKTVATQRLRSLGGRVGIEMPDDADLTEGARSKWVWSLSLLSLSSLLLTCNAIGWLQRAMADQADWDAAVAALGADGRFPVAYTAADLAASAADEAVIGGGDDEPPSPKPTKTRLRIIRRRHRRRQLLATLRAADPAEAAAAAAVVLRAAAAAVRAAPNSQRQAAARRRR